MPGLRGENLRPSQDLRGVCTAMRARPRRPRRARQDHHTYFSPSNEVLHNRNYGRALKTVHLVDCSCTRIEADCWEPLLSIVW